MKFFLSDDGNTLQPAQERLLTPCAEGEQHRQ